MIKITNGTRITTVTRGVYKAAYEGLGWEPVEEAQVVEPVVAPGPQIEVPLSEMKVSELRDLAEEWGIDISSAKSKKDMRDLIKAGMGA